MSILKVRGVGFAHTYQITDVRNIGRRPYPPYLTCIHFRLRFIPGNTDNVYIPDEHEKNWSKVGDKCVDNRVNRSRVPHRRTTSTSYR